MSALSRRAFLSTASAAAVVAGLPAGASVPVAPVAKAVAAPLPTWIVGTPGEWDHEIIRAATRELAVRFRADDCEEVEVGDEPDPDCDCDSCYGRRGYEATRVPQWDGRPENTIGSGDWLARGSEALCDRCGYETNPEYGHNVAGKAVCEDCMTLADWDIVDPERAAELRADEADEASAPHPLTAPDPIKES
jgi:anaerobic selenocysteine-containing dehydrogenase